MPEPVAIDYKTHILIGMRANGVMTVIADRPHVRGGNAISWPLTDDLACFTRLGEERQRRQAKGSRHR